MKMPAISGTLAKASMGTDTERLSALMRDGFDAVWRLLRRLGLPADAADDAAQEVFLVAARRLGEITPGSERSFLYGAALRIAQTARRRLSRDAQRHVQLDDTRIAATPTPEAALETRQQL